MSYEDDFPDEPRIEISPGIVLDLKKRIAELETVVRDYASHDSWRCAYYSECHCGLNEATDRLGLLRIPYPSQN